MPLDFEILSFGGLSATPQVRKLSNRKVISKVHQMTNISSAAQSFFALQVRPGICWGFAPFPIKVDDSGKPAPFKLGMFMELYLEASLGVQFIMGSWTHCQNEHLNLEIYHDYQLTFIIVTPLLWKIWRFWRYKEAIECWFCEKQCGVPVTILNPLSLNSSTTTVSS